MPASAPGTAGTSGPAGPARDLTTLLVGIDGMCEEVLAPLFVDGDLPTLWRLFTRGANDRLASQIPPTGASAWPSIFTGTNPGKHGVFDRLAFSGDEYAPVDWTSVRAPTLWEYASEHDLTSVVVNVPVTHPPSEFDGALVPGDTAPADPRCHPPGLLDDVREAVGPYRVYPRDTRAGGAGRDAIVTELVDLVRLRGDAFEYLAERFAPDFGFVQFQTTDSVVHELPGDREALAAVYRAVDDVIGRLIETYVPTYVLAVSDHGVGPADGYELRLNEVLRNEGYLSTVDSAGDDAPSPTTSYSERKAGPRAAGSSQRMSGKLTAGLARLGVTGRRVNTILEQLGFAVPPARLFSPSAGHIGLEQVDLQHSTAYVRSPTEYGVRINLDGREPHGTVSPQEYETVRQNLITLLSSLRTPDGGLVFETVDRREAFYDGPATTDAVDVVAVPTDFDHRLSVRLDGAVFGPRTESWGHTFDGVVAMVGPDIDPGRALVDASILDVAPTVLATLGVPVAAAMDGSVLPVVDGTGTEPYGDLDEVRVREGQTGSTVGGDTSSSHQPDP